jgi:hypothetical protein
MLAAAVGLLSGTFVGWTALAVLAQESVAQPPQPPEHAAGAEPPAALEEPPAPIQQSATPSDGSGEGPEDVQLPRLREGTQLTDRLGRFRQEGESVTFIDEEGRELGGLPNLGLERIIRALKGVEEPESVWWSVSGTVTEFSGRNYLLVSRAVYKAATLPPSPEQIGE